MSTSPIAGGGISGAIHLLREIASAHPSLGIALVALETSAHWAQLENLEVLVQFSRPIETKSLDID